VSVRPTLLSRCLSRKNRLVVVPGLIGVVALLLPPTGDAKVIEKVAPVRVSYKATKDASGTVTVELGFTSPNPKCISAVRAGHGPNSIRASIPGLFYGGPNRLYGAVGFDGVAVPPDEGLLAPFSTPGHSPWIWRAVWPGSAATAVEVPNIGGGAYNQELPKHYSSTVSAATGIKAEFVLRSAFFEYKQGKNLVSLSCGKVYMVAKAIPFS
jgi:hypothetical protein